MGLERLQGNRAFSSGTRCKVELVAPEPEAGNLDKGNVAQ
jgi:hypothetical protein